jgi:hypothetical protein
MFDTGHGFMHDMVIESEARMTINPDIAYQMVVARLTAAAVIARHR